MASLINQGVTQLAYESRLDAVNKLQQFLSEKIDFDDDMSKMFDEFKTALKTDHDSEVKVNKKGGKAKAVKGGACGVAAAPKEKKKPSAYNLFIKDKIAELKAQNPGMKNGKELLTMATEAWKANKASSSTA